MIQVRSLAWWIAVAALVGAVVTVAGGSLSGWVQAAIVLGAALVLAVYVAGYHAAQMAETNAAAAVGAAKMQTEAIAAAVQQAVAAHLSQQA